MTIILLNVLVITVTTKPRLYTRLYLNAFFHLIITIIIIIIIIIIIAEVFVSTNTCELTRASLTVCFNLKNTLAIMYNCSWKRMRSFLS